METMTSINALRPARRDDAADLAWFLNEASGGISMDLWTGMAKPGEDPWEVGRNRVLVEDSDNSWRNWVVAERTGAVAGGLCTYEIGPDPVEISTETSIRFRPMIELENLACGSLHIHVLAARHDHRKAGVGRALLAHAAEIAGKRPQTLIVDSRNTPACALYGAVGFIETARRPILDARGGATGGHWILLTRT